MKQDCHVLLFNTRQAIAAARLFEEKHYYQTAQIMLATGLRPIRELQFCKDVSQRAAIRETLYTFTIMRERLAETVQFEMAAKKIEVARGW